MRALSPCTSLLVSQRALQSFLAQSVAAASSSKEAVASRSVAPSPLATLLASLFPAPAEAAAADVHALERKQTLELSFKLALEAAVWRPTQPQRALPPVPFSDARNEVTLLLDAALWAKHSGRVEATTPLALLEDLLESH